VRPLHCIECGAKTWGPLNPGDGFWQWITAAAFWLLLLSMLLAPNTRPPASPQPHEAVAATLPTPAPVSAPAATPMTSPDVRAVATPMATSTPIPAMANVQTTLDSPADAGRRRMTLESVDVRWTGEAMEVVLRAVGGAFHPRLEANAGVGGYVLDLPGDWKLPSNLRMTRSFERSNLLRLRIGRHRDYLRIVFSLREPAAGAPELDEGDGRLRVLVR
jgi:hypothetical protein